MIQSVQTAGAAGGTVTGDTGSNRIVGAAGNDVFIATAGRDTYFGNGGTDVVRFNLGRGAGKVLSDLTASPINGSSHTSATGLNQTKFDTVERVEFADGRIEFDPGSTAITVQRLYAGLLGRQGDVAGLSFFTGATDRGQSTTTVAAAIAGSAEGQARAASLSNEAFVAQAYTGILNRAADAGGTSFFVGRLAAGASRAEVAAALAASAEARADAPGFAARGVIVQDMAATQAGAAYRAVLGRDVDAGGLGFFTSQLGGGGSLAGVVQALAASPEFTTRNAGLDSASFVRSLYDSALGRTPEAAGNSFFTTALVKGVSRSDVATAIALSDEAQQAAQSFYQTGIRVS